MYPGDSRSKWPATLLTDPRAIHLWDESRLLGTRYLAQLPSLMSSRAPATLTPTADALWDAFFVFPRGVRWADPMPHPASWGYPIMVTKDDLVHALDAALK